MYEWLNDYSKGSLRKSLWSTSHLSLLCQFFGCSSFWLSSHYFCLLHKEKGSLPTGHPITTPWATGQLRSLCEKNSSFPLSSIWARTRSSWPAASPEEKETELTKYTSSVGFILYCCLTNNTATNCSFQSWTHDRKFGPAFLACRISSNFARPSDSASRTSSNCRTCFRQLQATKKNLLPSTFVISVSVCHVFFAQVIHYCFVV